MLGFLLGCLLYFVGGFILGFLSGFKWFKWLVLAVVLFIGYFIIKAFGATAGSIIIAGIVFLIVRSIWRAVKLGAIGVLSFFD